MRSLRSLKDSLLEHCGFGIAARQMHVVNRDVCHPHRLDGREKLLRRPPQTIHPSDRKERRAVEQERDRQRERERESAREREEKMEDRQRQRRDKREKERER